MAITHLRRKHSTVNDEAVFKCANSLCFIIDAWLSLTGSRWKYWARLGRWSALSRSSLHPHLHRSCMRANKRPSTALDRWHRGEANTTNRPKTDPHAFSPLRFRWKRRERGGRSGAFVCGLIYSGRRLLLMWFGRLWTMKRWSLTDAFQNKTPAVQTLHTFTTPTTENKKQKKCTHKSA